MDRKDWKSLPKRPWTSSPSNQRRNGKKIDPMRWKIGKNLPEDPPLKQQRYQWGIPPGSKQQISSKVHIYRRKTPKISRMNGPRGSNQNFYRGQGGWLGNNGNTASRNSRGNFGRGFGRGFDYEPERYAHQNQIMEQWHMQPRQSFQPYGQRPFMNGYGGQRGQGRQGRPRGKRNFNNNQYPNRGYRGIKQPGTTVPHL